MIDEKELAAAHLKSEITAARDIYRAALDAATADFRRAKREIEDEYEDSIRAARRAYEKATDEDAPTFRGNN